MKYNILAISAAALLSACGQGPVSDDANNVGTAAEVEMLPPDENVVAPANDLDSRVEDPAAPSGSLKIPASMHGRWGLTPGDCTSTRGDAKGLMIVSADSLKFYESSAKPAGELKFSADSASGDFAFTGEGMTWKKYQSLELQGASSCGPRATRWRATPTPAAPAEPLANQLSGIHQAERIERTLDRAHGLKLRRRCEAFQLRQLHLPDAMLGGDRTACEGHEVVDHLRNLGRAFADRIAAHVEVHVSIAEMAESASLRSRERLLHFRGSLRS